MNEKQKEILGIIKTFIEENGYSPTVREICSLSGLNSTASVNRHIDKLRAEGHITRKSESPRSIVVVDKENIVKKEKKVKLVVNAIALFREYDKDYILMEENKMKKAKDTILELPGGFIKDDENVYGCLRRTLNSKGFPVSKIFGEDKSNELSNEDEAVTVYNPFCISQSFTEKSLIITNTILCEVDKEKVKSVRNKPGFKWVCTESIDAMLEYEKENISTHNIAALKLFCKDLK